MNPQRPALPASGWRRLPPLAALLFIVLLLLLFNLPLWRLLRVIEPSLAATLDERLRWSAQFILNDLKVGGRPPLVLDLVRNQPREQEAELLDAFGDTAAYQALERRIISLASANELAQVALITTSGLVVADSTQKTGPGDGYRLLAIDRTAFDEAVAGRKAATPLYRVDGVPFKRLYLPLNSDGRVTAVLQVGISPEYLSELDTLRRRVRLQSLASSVLLVLLAVSVWRLFAYLFKMEQRAMQSARVEAMGALAGGVAHELRNPLSIVRVLAEEIASENPAESRSSTNARDIVAETERLNELVTHFLSLSRPPELGGAEPVDLAEEVGRVVQLVRKGERAGVRFVEDLPQAPVPVRADERALRQVLLNLLLNARDAMDGREGEVRITLRARRGNAEITITDSGPGIAPRDLARAFEPFFTTKANGTGLGLAISRGIVENLGGTIRLLSEPGRGTTVEVVLPEAEG